MRDFARSRPSTWLAAVPMESGIALLCGVLLTFLRPFYTSRAPVALRLVYWVGLSLAWVVVSQAVEATLARSATLRGLARWQRLALTLAVGSVPMSALAAVATRRLDGLPFSDVELALLYVQVAVICAGISLAIEAFVERSSRPAPGVATADEASGRASTGPRDEAMPGAVAPAGSDRREAGTAGRRLLSRLPPSQRGRLRCLAGEDHYVRIYTDRGAPLVLMRFRDALEELDGVPGERVHRSWWVARGEPCAFRRSGRTAVLELAGDLVVPVSTPYLDAAKALALPGP